MHTAEPTLKTGLWRHMVQLMVGTRAMVHNLRIETYGSMPFCITGVSIHTSNYTRATSIVHVNNTHWPSV